MGTTCDRCGAAAKVSVLLQSGSGLAFCGHHWTEHQAKIEPIADVVVNLEEETV